VFRECSRSHCFQKSSADFIGMFHFVSSRLRAGSFFRNVMFVVVFGIASVSSASHCCSGEMSFIGQSLMYSSLRGIPARGSMFSRGFFWQSSISIFIFPMGSSDLILLIL